MGEAFRAGSMTILTVVFSALVIVFIGLYISNLDLNVFMAIELDWRILGMASVAGVLFRYWGCFSWLQLLKGLGARDLNKYRELVLVYAKSWLGRYIPGTIPWVLSRIYFASRHGVPAEKLAVSAVVEGVLQVLVLLAVSFLFLSLDGRASGLIDEYRALMFTLFLLLLVLLSPCVFNRAVSLASHFLKRDAVDPNNEIGWQLIIRGFLLYGFGGALSGLSFFFIAQSVNPSVGWESLVFLIGAANLSGAISMMAFFSPGGIGVREGVLLLLLGLMMSPEAALMVTLLSRLWGVLLDMVFYVLARLAFVK